MGQGMKHFALKVRDSGNYLRKDDIEWRLIVDDNKFYNLQMRFIEKDHSDEPNDGWSTVFISSGL